MRVYCHGQLVTAVYIWNGKYSHWRCQSCWRTLWLVP